MSVDYCDTDAECIAYNESLGIEFPTISGIEGGGQDITVAYGIPAVPCYIVIAPNHDIVIDRIWPPLSTQIFINAFEGVGIEQASCDATANFTSDTTSACGEGTVNFTDMSTGVIESWLWTFEGGDPETSTEENPTVFYNAIGSWDVTLNVNGEEGDTFTIEDYIDIFEIPDVTQEPFDVACVFWIPFELTGGMPEGGEYSGDGVTDGMFDPEAAGLGDHTITYTYVSDDGCENSVEENLYVDACTGIDEIIGDAIQVYPNPAVDIVNISSNSNMVSVSIYNITGQIMITKENISGDYKIDISNLKKGIYIVHIVDNEKTVVKKITITN